MVPGNSFPVGFEANGGDVTAALDGFDTVIHCSGSHGVGQITGPRSALSNYVFTGCVTHGGSEGGRKCKSAGASEEEIKTGTIGAELVYLDQAKREVGMVLNPGGGAYMDFECEGVAVEGSGPFLSPVGPINQVATSFTAILTRSNATQVPSEYENANGDKVQAIPMGKKGSNPLATTGVELSFAIQTSVPLQIRAVTTKEIEAKQREEEAAAAKKRQEEEAAAAKKRQEEQRVKEERLRRHRLLSKALTQCRKAQSKPARIRCEKRAKHRYGSHRGSKKTASATAGTLLGRRL